MAVVEQRVTTGRITRLPTLESYVELVLANIFVIIASTLAGGAIGYIAQRQVPPTYRVSASVELPDVPTWVDLDPNDPIPDRTTIDTTSQLVFTPPVFRQVADVTELSTVRVRDHLSVSAYPLSRVLIITFEDRNAELARAGAEAAAEGLISERATGLAGEYMRQLSRLDRRLKAIQRGVAKDNPYSELARRIKAQLLQIQSVRQDAGGNGGRVVDYSAARPVPRHPELQVVTGLVLGLLAGIIYAWWRPRSRPSDHRLIGGPEAVARPARQIGRRLSPLGARLRLGRPSFLARARAVSRLRR